jgi:hypothetical protein
MRGVVDVAEASRAIRAFGGGDLAGDQPVRIVYLDEAGNGSEADDHYLVVAGVMIHADTQWGAISKRLQDVLKNATPPDIPNPPFLHAQQIYHGTRDFKKEDWPRPVREALLDATAAVIADFKLPVVWGAVDRWKWRKDHPDHTPEMRLTGAYALAATICFIQSEWLMQHKIPSSEVASIVFEQNKDVQKHVPMMYEFLRNPTETDKLYPWWRNWMPITRIIDQPSYQPKSGSSILQLADYCAFSVRRRTEKRRDGIRLSEHLMPNAIALAMTDAGIVWNPALTRSWPSAF